MVVVRRSARGGHHNRADVMSSPTHTHRYVTTPLQGGHDIRAVVMSSLDHERTRMARALALP